MTTVLPLDPHEERAWQGRPRLTTVLPSLGLGILLIAGGVVATLLEGPNTLVVLGAALVLSGVGVPTWTYLRVTNTRYVVTDLALYRKTGVISRSVRRVELTRIQDSSFSQPLRGRLFGWGTVAFEVAGGGSLRFSRIDDPEEVRRLVDRATDRTDIPGSLDQWKQVREEVRALRRAVER